MKRDGSMTNREAAAHEAASPATDAISANMPAHTFAGGGNRHSQESERIIAEKNKPAQAWHDAKAVADAFRLREFKRIEDAYVAARLAVTEEADKWLVEVAR